jgi:hypothetical protein
MNAVEFRITNDNKYCNVHCEGCGFELSGNTGYDGVYTNTDITVSYLFRKDLETFYKIEPLCNMCLLNWLERYAKPISEKLSDTATKIQRWFRKYYFIPPCEESPSGGLGYRKAKESFRCKIGHVDEYKL